MLEYEPMGIQMWTERLDKRYVYRFEEAINRRDGVFNKPACND
jgi:hypothetical protein